MKTSNPAINPVSLVSDSYIVRIYRRDCHDCSKIIGTVENIHTGHIDSFKNARMLVEMLTHPPESIPYSNKLAGPGK